MTHVTGIGGIFIRTGDQDRLVTWYRTHLGIDMDKPPWFQQAGPTVFATFSQDSTYLGPASQQWMLNLRVQDLDGLMDKLSSAGIAIETRAEWDSEIGRFARIHDPDGNPVELWEPPQS